MPTFCCLLVGISGSALLFEQRSVVLMMESILKTLNTVKGESYYFNDFLSASAWSSLLKSDNFC